jgi:hypothetical protein
MKYLSVLGIFWLAIWTVPGGPAAGAWGWAFRALVLTWGFYLCRKILTTDGHR